VRGLFLALRTRPQAFRRHAGIEHPVSDIRHQDGNRPILTFCDILDHFPAVVQRALTQKLSAGGENRSTRTAATADLEDAVPARADGSAARCCAAIDFPPVACKEASMARSNLKIYRGPGETKTAVRTASKSSTRTVTVNVGDVLPLLADAVASKRTWLGDFEDDEITISADLYEVLLAYQYYRHPAA
jgi:hypothetical protein